MAQLAIKGHPTRRSKVIALLEMLGGVNKYNLKGDEDEWFILNGKQIQRSDRLFAEKGFTIEAFLEKYPYKVEDKVSSKYLKNYKIEKMEWEVTNNRVIYKLQGMGWYSAEELQPYKEETMEVSEEFFNKYCKKCGSQRCTAEGEWLKECKYYKEETMEELRIDFPEGYGYAGIENKQVIFTKIKPQYPKTCEECLKILGKTMNSLDNMRGYKYDLFMRLQQLLISREAYWKIAGEQMGLGKPWEPDFTNDDEERYGMYTSANKVEKEFYGGGDINTILTFPTEEMRNIFYENFKELIESCKELL